MRVYCNASTVFTEVRGNRMFMRDVTVGRTWAYRLRGRYLCSSCGKPVPAAW